MSSQVPKQLQDVFQYIDGKQAAYISDLKDYISIKSTSIHPESWPVITELIKRFGKRLGDLGAETEIVNIGQFLGGGDKTYPPILFGSLGNDPKKKTILLYFHLDVHMVKPDRWDSDPFTLVEKNGVLVGRGVSNSKGPALCWIHVLEAYNELKQLPPVNVKFVVEGLFERTSPGFEAACLTRKAFVSHVDCIVMTNNIWIGSKKPCVVYGVRGVCCFEVAIKGMNRDLHSGDYGGVVCEPMSDLIMIMNALQDHNYKITIPGVMRDVVEPTEEDYRAMQKIELDVDELRELVGTTRLAHSEKKERILMHRWRIPSLSLHGVEGAETDEWEKTIIPSRVIGKFSIRIVDNQSPEHVGKCVVDYIEHMWKEMSSPNSLEVKMTASTRPWADDPNSPIFKVALKAVRHAYGTEGQMIRAGTTNGISVPLKQMSGKPLVLLCIGTSESRLQCPNEQIQVKRFMEGHKLMAAFMHEVAESL